jgi:hypothetical protein
MATASRAFLGRRAAAGHGARVVVMCDPLAGSLGELEDFPRKGCDEKRK